MALVLQIVVAVVVLVGLITTIMSVKNWHWAQMLLLLSIFFTALGVMILGMEVFRIHRNLRAGMPAKLAAIEDLEEDTAALRQGTRNAEVIARVFASPTFENGIPYDAEAEKGHMPGLPIWRSRLNDQARARGRVWNGVKAAGPIDPATGRIPVTIAAPKPHGLEAGMIVYAFDVGLPNGPAPEQGRQYLGEFRIEEVRDDGVTLESVQKLDNRTGGRLERSAQNPQHVWRLYGTMPGDRHELFAGLSEEELKKLLPAATINEYVRHGGEPTPDDDEYHRAAFNGEQRVALDDPAKTVERYDRPLRDYSYLFGELARQGSILRAELAGLILDNTRLKAAQANALLLTAHREKEIAALEQDEKFMERDRQTIEKLRDTVQAQLANARGQVASMIPANAETAAQWIERQMSRLSAAGAPAGGGFTAAQP